MKRLFQHILIIIAICGLISAVLTSCSGKKTDAIIIMLNNPGDDLFPFDDYFEVERIVDVSVQGEFKPLSNQIEYVHIAEGYAFIWDYENLTISKIDLNTGVIVSQIPTGSENYINMKGDDEHLYLLKRFKKIIHVYDLDLKEQDTISFKFIPALSAFAKTKDGFIFLNTYNNKKKGRFIMTDDKSSKAISFIHSSKEEIPQLLAAQGGTPKTSSRVHATMIYSGDLFMPYPNGKILCFDPENNKAYLYDGKKMKKLFQINTDSYNWETRAPFIIQIGSIRDNKLFVYYYNWNYYLAYYDKKYNLIAHGSYCPSHGLIISTPIWQKDGDKLISIVVPEEETVPNDPGKTAQAQIVIYRPK